MPYIEIELNGYGKIRGKCLDVYTEKDGIQRDLTASEIKERLNGDNSKILKFFSLGNCECETMKIKFLLENEKLIFDRKFGNDDRVRDLGAEKYIKEALGNDCCYL